MPDLFRINRIRTDDDEEEKKKEQRQTSGRDYAAELGSNGQKSVITSNKTTAPSRATSSSSGRDYAGELTNRTSGIVSNRPAAGASRTVTSANAIQEAARDAAAKATAKKVVNALLQENPFGTYSATLKRDEGKDLANRVALSAAWEKAKETPKTVTETKTESPVFNETREIKNPFSKEEKEPSVHEPEYGLFKPVEREEEQPVSYRVKEPSLEKPKTIYDEYELGEKKTEKVKEQKEDPEALVNRLTLAAMQASDYYANSRELRNTSSENPYTDIALKMYKTEDRLGRNTDQEKTFADKLYEAMGGDAVYGTYYQDPFSYLKYADEYERSTVNYLSNTGQDEKLTEYLEALKPVLEKRQTGELTQISKDFAKEMPVTASVMSVLQAPTRGLSYIGQVLDFAADGEIDENAIYNMYSRTPEAYRSAVSKKINNQFGDFFYQTGMSMADFLVTALVSGAFSGGYGTVQLGSTAVDISEALSLSIMGTGAAASSTIEAKERGLDDSQAFALGTIAGLAEVVTEKVSLETLLNPDLEKGALSYIIKNTLAEGSEEVASDLINNLADILIAADKSKLLTRVQEIMREEGVSEQEALGRAVAEQARDTGLSFAGGALSGAAMAGGGAAFNWTNFQNARKEYANENGISVNQLDALDDIAKETDPDVQKTLAAAWQKDVESGNSGLKDAATRRAWEEFAKENPGMAEMARRGADVVQAENTINDVVDGIGIEITDAGRQAIQNAYDGKQDAQSYALDAAAAYSLGRSGQTTLEQTIDRISRNENGTSVQAIEQAYSAGRADNQADIETRNTNLKQAQLETIRNSEEGKKAGRMGIRNLDEIKTFSEAVDEIGGVEAFDRPDAPISMSQVQEALDNGEVTVYSVGDLADGKIAYTSELEAVQKANGAEVVATTVPTDSMAWLSVEQGQYTGGGNGKRNLLLHGSGQRADVQSAGKQTGRMAEGAGAAAQSGRGRFQAKDSAIADQNYTGKEVSAVTLGIPKGTNRSTARLWTGEMTDTMKAAKKMIEKRGLKAVFFVGGNLSVGKGAANVRGAYDPSTGKIYVRADHATYDSLQIAAHEVFHDVIAKETRLSRKEHIDNMWNELSNVIEKDTADAVLDLYTQAYSYMLEDEDGNKLTGEKLEKAMYDVKEEILADFYAGLNTFENARMMANFADPVNDVLSRAEPFRNLVNEAYANDAADVQGKDQTKATRFSKEVSFADQVDESLAGRWNRYDSLYIGDTGDVLQGIGLKEYPLLMTQQHLRSVTAPYNEKKHHHGIPASIVKELPSLLKTPAMAFESSTKPGDIVVVTTESVTLPSGQKTPVIAIIHPDGVGKVNHVDIASNFVTSVYGKNNIANLLNNAIQNDKMLFADAKRIHRLTGVLPVQFRQGLINDGFYEENIARFSQKSQTLFTESDFAKASSEVDSDNRQLSKAQQEFFKDSKVRDEDGNLLVVYHGTDQNFTVFDRTKGRSTMDIQGSFFSPWEIDAGGYGPNVQAYYLNITNPASEGVAYKALNRFKGQNNAGIKAREYLESLGYDGVNNSGEEYIAFTPEQIKSVDNLNPTRSNADIRYSRETDPETLKRLNSEPTVKVYRAMQEIDGKLYPPMAAKVEGKLVEPTETGVWYRADERPDLIKNGKFKLDKANGSAIEAAYNPYWHTSRSMLNDQFSSAYKRPNLVTVECEVPASELSSGYKAEFAKDSVGEMQWHSGPVSSKLAKAGNPRQVILSRWVKVNHVVSNAEAAATIAKMLNGTDIEVPVNTVTPSLRDELIRNGVTISGYDPNTRYSQETDSDKSSEVNGYYEQTRELYDLMSEANPYDLEYEQILDGLGTLHEDVLDSSTVEQFKDAGLSDKQIGRIQKLAEDLDWAFLNKKFTRDDIRYLNTENGNEFLTDNNGKPNGVELVDGSAVRYSLETWTKTNKDSVLKSLTKAGFERTQALRWMHDVNSIASIIAQDRTRLDYDAADNQVMLKNNMEYVKTLDASTLCAKRLLYQGTFNRITELLPDTVLMPDDLIRIRQIMDERGDTVPCGICYVESRRKTLSKFAGQWLNEVYKGDVKVNMNDLTSTDGLERLRKGNAKQRDVYEKYTKWMRARGTANPKVVELRTAYRGEIMRLTQNQIDKITRIGGLRIQSFSDFESVHLIDMMQAVLDMASRKMTAQAYTKVPNFAWAFGDTGIKINLSLIGKAVDGKLVFDSKEGMDINDAMKLRKRYSENVGTILVGANEESIRLAMADDRIDFIIPFHRSGWSGSQFEALGLMGYDDFQDYQNERNLDGSSIKEGNLYPIDYWNYDLTGKQNAERYLEICKEQKRIPKFEQFLTDNGDGSWSLPADGSADGYWKMLIDFKMYNNEGIGAPQMAVTPNFNMEESERILREYDGTGNRSLPVDEEVARMFAEEYKRTHEGERFSMEAERGNEEFLSTIKELREELEKQTARAEYFKGQTRLTKGAPQLSEATVDKLTRSMIRSYESTANYEETKKNIAEYASWVGKNISRIREDSFMDEAYAKAVDLVRPVVLNTKQLVNPEMIETGKMLREYLKGGRGISISADDRRALTTIGYDNYNQFRRENFGKIKITNDGPKIDQVWSELQDQFGKNFFPDECYNTLDQLARIQEVFEELEPMYGNPFDNAPLDAEIAVDYAARNVMQRMLAIATKEMAPTYADKMHARLDAEHQKAVEKVREAGRKAREQRDRKINDLKQHYKQVNEEKRYLVHEAANRNRLLKIARRMLNKKLPLVTKARIVELVGNLDLEATSMTGETFKNLTELKEWYDEQKKSPDFIPMPDIEAKLARLEKRQIGSAREARRAQKDSGFYFTGMTQEEVADLTEILLNIEHEIEYGRKLINDQDKRDVRAMTYDILADIKSSTGINVGRKNKAYMASRNLMIDENLSPRSFFHRMTGYVDSDPLYRSYEGLNDGQTKMLDYQMRASDMFTKWTEDKQFVREHTGKNAATVTGMFGGQTVTMTRGQLIDLYMDTLNDDNMRHVAYGGKMFPDVEMFKKGNIEAAYDKAQKVRISPSEARAFFNNEGALTDQEKAFVHKMQEYFSGMSHDELNAVCLDLYGYERALVDDYYPITVDKDNLPQDLTQIATVNDATGEITLNPGFLQTRQKAVQPIFSKNALDVLNDSIRKSSQFVGMAIPLRNFSKLFTARTYTFEDKPSLNGDAWMLINDENVIGLVRSKWGSKAVDSVSKLLTDIQGQRAKTDDVEKLASFIRGNYAGAVLTTNLSVAMKQFASYPTAAAILGWKPLIKAWNPSHKYVGKVDIELMRKYTPLYWYRAQGYSNTELGEITKKGVKLPKYLNWIQAIDLFTTRRLWRASEYWVRENTNLENGTDEYYMEVAKKYNEVIQQTQPNYTVMQRPENLRASGVKALVMMFKTQPFQNFNVIYDAVGNYRAKIRQYKIATEEQLPAAKKALKEAQRSLFNATTALTVSTALFSALALLWGLGRRKYDDPEDAAKDFAKGIGSSVFGMVPFGSEAFDWASTLITKEKYWGFETIVSGAFDDFLTSTHNLIDRMAEGKRPTTSQIINMAKYLAQFMGIPLSNALNIINIGFAWAGEESLQKWIENQIPPEDANWLYDARKDKKVTRKEIAEACGVKESTVAGWESGETPNISKARITALAQLLGMSEDQVRKMIADTKE